jgi:hypothetical protein
MVPCRPSTQHFYVNKILAFPRNLCTLSPFHTVCVVSTLLVGVLSISILGCPGSATVPLAPPALDQRAKEFAPPPDHALIYVVHEPIQTISWTLFRVTVDGTPRGVVAAGTYLVFAVAPGSHSVGVLTSENYAEQKLDMAAGQIAVVYLTREMGWNTTRVGMRLLGDAEGRDAVRASALAETVP